MPKEFIVAIELGSSKMTGIAGSKNMDGSITVHALVSEDSASFIRKGVIYNIDKTVLCLTGIVKKLETALKTKIAHVYVGVGGRSICSVRNTNYKDLPANTIVTQDMVNELMDENRNMNYPDQEILDAVMQEFRVDNQFQLDPVGIQCTHIEGNFLNILWRKAFYRNLNQCFDKAGIAIAEMYLAPLALADSVLTDAERRAGCMLVDLGADTTTVSVYHKDILRHLAVIPLGSNNITKDITSLQMEEADAQKMKLKYGCAWTASSDIDTSLQLPIDSERTVESRRFIEIVEGRIEEIIANAWNQVPREFIDKLLGGIILTGGGANMKNMEAAFREYTHVQKVRTAKFVTHTINSNLPEINGHNAQFNTLLGLLAKGDMNCAGTPLTDDLFQAAKPQAADAAAKPVRQQAPLGQGVVATEAEKAEAERLRLLREHEEQRQREEQEAAERERMAREKRENSAPHKAWKAFKKFVQKVTEEEE